MPGLPKHPAALDIDVDNNGKISGYSNEESKQVLYLVISLLVVIADQGLKNYIVTNFK